MLGPGTPTSEKDMNMREATALGLASTDGCSKASSGIEEQERRLQQKLAEQMEELHEMKRNCGDLVKHESIQKSQADSSQLQESRY